MSEEPDNYPEVAALLDGMGILAVRHLSTREISITAAATLGRLARTGPTRLTGLAAAEGVSQPSMTQLVQRLSRQGLVSRIADRDDGRVVLIAITDAGRTVLAERQRARIARLDALLATLTEEDREVLADVARTATPVLHRLVENALRAEHLDEPPTV